MPVFYESIPFVEEPQFQIFMFLNWFKLFSSIFNFVMGRRDFHTEDYSHGFHQAEKTSFNVRIHTKPNLMRNVGCCYGNSICWNFSLLASLWHYILKRIIWKGVVAAKTNARPRRWNFLILLSPKVRTCHYIAMPPQHSQRVGWGGVILRFHWNAGVYFFLS